LDNEIWAEVMCVTSGKNNLMVTAPLFMLSSECFTAEPVFEKVASWQLLCQPESQNNIANRSPHATHISHVAQETNKPLVLKTLMFGGICYYIILIWLYFLFDHLKKKSIKADTL
jgi:hypothetical protein